jgi:predicted ATPase
MKQTCYLGDIQMLHPDASNIAAFLYRLKQEFFTYYTKIVNVIQLVAPFFDDFVLEPRSADNSPDQSIRLEWKEKGYDQVFSANVLSDGTLRFICLTTLLLQPPLPTTPSLIIIDEPELGLHPAAITLLSSLIKEASNSVQILISTQSVTLINQFTSEDIITVNREQNQSNFKRLISDDLKEWLEDYAIGELWEKNVFGGRP